MVRKTYTKAQKRAYAKKMAGKRSKGSKSVWKTAVKAAQSVIKKQAEPLWCTKEFGAFDATSGQYADLVNLVPGASNGFYDDKIVQIQLPANNQDQGLPGTRADQGVQITGIKISLRIFIPYAIKSSRVNCYLALAQDALVDTTLFLPPDQTTMLRATPAIKEKLSTRRILSSKTIVLRQSDLGNLNNTANLQSYDYDLWYPFKTPFNLKFEGDGFEDYLNRRFVLCIKPSYQFATGGHAANRLSFVGKCTTYYRDI